MDSRRIITPSLTLITGTMFGGKSTDLMRQISRYKIVGYNVLTVKPTRDTRSKDLLASHDGTEMHSVFNLHNLTDVLQLDSFASCDVVAIEEGQFFEDISLVVPTLLNVHHKIVIVAMLNCDYKGNPFTNTLPLYSQAEYIHRLTSICMECKSDHAIFAHRKSNEKEIVVIGGIDVYTPLCRTCFNKQNSSN